MQRERREEFAAVSEFRHLLSEGRVTLRVHFREAEVARSGLNLRGPVTCAHWLANRSSLPIRKRSVVRREPLVPCVQDRGARSAPQSRITNQQSRMILVGPPGIEPGTP